MSEPITHTIPRREDQSFDDALASWLFVNGLLDRVRGVASGPVDGKEIAVRFEDLDELDDETLEDLHRAVGLDDPEEEVCSHKKTIAQEDGRWTCATCEADTTAVDLDRLINTIEEALAKAAPYPAGHRAVAAAVIEASAWMTHARRTADYVAERTRAGYPEILT